MLISGSHQLRFDSPKFITEGTRQVKSSLPQPGAEDQGAAHGFKTGLEITGVPVAYQVTTVVLGGCGYMLVTMR